MVLGKAPILLSELLIILLEEDSLSLLELELLETLLDEYDELEELLKELDELEEREDLLDVCPSITHIQRLLSCTHWPCKIFSHASFFFCSS